MKRRRLVIVLVTLLCFVALVYWGVAREHDPRLVGQWRASPAPRRFISVDAEWEFLSDGTGRRCGKLRPPDDTDLVSTAADASRNSSAMASKPSVAIVRMQGRFRWWTEGDRLYVKPLTSRSAWQRTYESVSEFFREMAGRPQGRIVYPTWEYRFAVEENRIRVTPESIPRSAESVAFELTHLDVDSTP
jgi:hypothetical protein